MSVTSQQQTSVLRARVRELLAEGTIELFIGYRQGSGPLKIAPYVATASAEVERLVWNEACITSLVPSLRKYPGRRVGILLKGCDARTLDELIQLHQLRREDLYIIGVPCSGILDPEKIETLCGSGRASAVEVEGDQVVVTLGQERFAGTRAQLVYANSLDCTQPTPLLYDELLAAGAPPPLRADEVAADGALDQLDLAGRFAFWSEQLSACTLCYACQTICPLCFCKQCTVTLERSDPQHKQRSRQTVFAFHLLRAFHLADRCTGCNECERVCPVDIPLSLIFQQVSQARRQQPKAQADNLIGLSPTNGHAPAQQKSLIGLSPTNGHAPAQQKSLISLSLSNGHAPAQPLPGAAQHDRAVGSDTAQEEPL